MKSAPKYMLELDMLEQNTNDGAWFDHNSDMISLLFITYTYTRLRISFLYHTHYLFNQIDYYSLFGLAHVHESISYVKQPFFLNLKINDGTWFPFYEVIIKYVQHKQQFQVLIFLAFYKKKYLSRRPFWRCEK